MTNKDYTGPAYLIMTNIEPDDWCVEFAEERTVLGRGERADVRIPPRFPLVSRCHAEIWRDRDGIKIRDIGSTAGTHINGVWINDQHEATLEIGDRIWMGGVDLQVVDQVALNPEIEDAGSPKVEMETCFDLDTLYQSAREGKDLSQAELEVALLIARGCVSDVDIGRKLFRSPNTIRTQVNSIYRKLNVHSRAEIVAHLKRAAAETDPEARNLNLARKAQAGR